MKKISYSKLIFLLVAVSTFFLTACSSASSINTYLNINSDFSGSREMHIAIDNAVLAEHFDGTIEDIQAIVQSNIPSEFTWSYDEAGFHVSLPFSSLEDYKKKVQSVLGEEASVEINIPQTVWANGIYIQESFSSADLLGWFRNAMVEGGYVQESDAGYIFSLAETKVVFEGEEIITNAQIYVDNVESVQIAGIDFLTEAAQIDRYHRQIIFRIPRESLNKKEAQIRAFFEERVPKSAELSEEPIEDGLAFIVTAADLDRKGIEKFEEALFGKGNVSFQGSGSLPSQSPFIFSADLSESIDFADFRAGSGSIPTNTFLKAGENYAFEINGEYFEINKNTATSKSDLYKGYLELSSNFATESGYASSLLLFQQYRLSSVEIKLSRALFGAGWKREMDFVLEGEPLEEDKERILAGIHALAEIPEPSKQAGEESRQSEEGETEAAKEEKSKTAKIEVKEIKTKDGKAAIRIKQGGSLEEIEESSLRIFGFPEELLYERERGVLSLKKQEAFYEMLDLYGFIGRQSSDFRINYTVNFGLGSKMLYQESNAASSEMQSGKLVASFGSQDMVFSYVGTRLDILSVLFFFFMAAAILSAVILLIGGIIKRGGKNRKEWKAEEVFEQGNKTEKRLLEIDRENPAGSGGEASEGGEMSQNPPPSQEKVLRCRKCNALIRTDSVFCEECGEKVKQ